MENTKITKIINKNVIFKTFASLKHCFNSASSSSSDKELISVLSKISNSIPSKKGMFILFKKSKAFLYSLDGLI